MFVVMCQSSNTKLKHEGYINVISIVIFTFALSKHPSININSDAMLLIVWILYMVFNVMEMAFYLYGLPQKHVKKRVNIVGLSKGNKGKQFHLQLHQKQ